MMSTRNSCQKRVTALFFSPLVNKWLFETFLCITSRSWSVRLTKVSLLNTPQKRTMKKRIIWNLSPSKWHFVSSMTLLSSVIVALKSTTDTPLANESVGDRGCVPSRSLGFADLNEKIIARYHAYKNYYGALYIISSIGMVAEFDYSYRISVIYIRILMSS